MSVRSRHDDVTRLRQNAHRNLISHYPARNKQCHILTDDLGVQFLEFSNGGVVTKPVVTNYGLGPRNVIAGCGVLLLCVGLYLFTFNRRITEL